jgi:hypothetical protein
VAIHEFVFKKLYCAVKSVICLCAVYARGFVKELLQRKISHGILGFWGRTNRRPLAALFIAVELGPDADWP